MVDEDSWDVLKFINNIGARFSGVSIMKTDTMTALAQLTV